MEALQQPLPHYTSGRYSARNLTEGYQGVQDYHQEHETESHRAGPTTPTPTTPVALSSAFAGSPASRSATASTGLGNHTHLTIPEPDDEAACGVIQSIAVPNPFKETAENENAHLIVRESAMDVLCDEDEADPIVIGADLSSGAELTPFSDDLTGSDSNGARDDMPISTLELRQDLGRDDQLQAVICKLSTGVGEEEAAGEEPPAEEEPTAEEEPPVEAEPPVETEPPIEAGPPAEDEPPIEEEPPAGKKTRSELPVKDIKAADPNYETNGNWDLHGEVQKHLDEYEAFKASIEGHEKWTEEQARLHKLIALRGSWPMLQKNWTFHFRMRNIYPWVYAPQGTSKRVAINAKSNEFLAAKALEALFDLSPLICSYRQINMESRIGPSLHKAIERHIDWAIRDAGLENRIYIPTLQIYEFDPAAYDAKDGGSDADSDSDPISDEVEKRLRKLAAEHRRHLVLPGLENLPEAEWEYGSRPPLLFAFVIVQHMIMLINLDSSHPSNDIVVFVEINMAEVDQWLWNALAITLPVHMARDALWDIKDILPVVDEMEVDDPDL